jgi:hypothetical protein
MPSITPSIGENYVHLAYKVDAFLKEALGPDTIVVDCYFGPDLPDGLTKTVDPDQLLSDIKTLQKSVKTKAVSAQRRIFLTKQLEAMSLLVKYALKEKITFEQRVRTGLDVDIVTVRSERIEELAEHAARVLSKKVRKADLTTMATQWRKSAIVKGTEVVEFAQNAAKEARNSTQRLLFKLPEEEHIDFRPVEKAPWSAYHYYQGNYSALIEINIQLPRSKYAIWGWVTHETYPGHQTQLVSREFDYNRQELDVEATVALINTPDCVIAEGLANSGATILQEDRPLTEAEKITGIIGKLRRAVGINALVMMHQQNRSESEVLNYLIDSAALEEEYAKAQMPFMTDPMWGPYGFTYFIGEWLVKGFFEASKEANLKDEFVKALYHELHVPSTLQARIRELDLKLPPLSE